MLLLFFPYCDMIVILHMPFIEKNPTYAFEKLIHDSFILWYNLFVFLTEVWFYVVPFATETMLFSMS